jgi:hypothetical protein
MGLTAEERHAMKEATSDIAWNMADDIAHIRQVLTNPTSGDVRRMSNVLRRLLIDNGGDLNKIAPPRMNRKLKISAPNMTGLDERYKMATPHIGSIGNSGIFGRNIFLIDIFGSTASSSTDSPQIHVGFEFARSNPSAPDELVFEPPPVSVSQGKFLSQQVLWCWNVWVRRGEIVKYIANVAGGVHSGGHKSHVEQMLQRARNVGGLKLVNGEPTFSLHPVSIHTGERPIDIARDGIDFVLLQVLCAARYLVMSPDIIELENLVRSEARYGGPCI